MGEYASIEQVITLAERRWPGLEFRRKDHREAGAPCPFCHQAVKDGFLLFEDGGFFCRKCGVRGWIDDDAPRKLTPQELNEIRLRRLERKQEEHERRLTALEQMARCRDHIAYHAQLDDDDRAYWESQGMWAETIDRYLLGICYDCPTARHHASYTIPVINGGKLVNIRHRLADAPNGDKYRPHMAGLGNTLFNADNLYAGHESIIVVEGEKKSIVLGQWGFPSVGMMGKAGFPPHWAQRFTDLQRVLVALDPDATDEAYKLARLFGDRGRVVMLPCKPDDFFLAGGTDQNFRAFLRWAKKGRAS